jgi:AP2 domain/HNH endonuclease
MVAARLLPDLNILRDHFRIDYSVPSGLVHIKHHPHGGARRQDGAPANMAGTRNRDGWGLHFQGRRMLVARVIWKLHYEEEPPPLLDHRDLDNHNNKIRNLRPATKSQNGYNRTAYKCNKTGVKGVCFLTKRNKFVAQIRRNNVHHNLGHFDTLEAAAAAYALASEQLHGPYGRTK